jgi:hypothetical protein
MRAAFLPFMILLVLAHTTLHAQFRFRDLDEKSLELLDGDAPVFVYNRGMILKQGVREDRARCCYLAPVYAPNGVVITDDFPREELHHRGIFWAWPVVKVDGQAYDLWRLTGIHARPVRLLRKRVDKDKAILGVENRWFVGDRAVVQERVEIVARATKSGQRDLDFIIRLRALVNGIEIAGEPEQHKGYGGLGIRFARRTATVLKTADDRDVPDSDSIPAPWAQLTGNFGGKEAGARITIDPANPGFPNPWCFRHYGFLGVNYPGLAGVRLSKAKALVLKYRVTLLAGARPATGPLPGLAPASRR